ncbi:MAG TPA: hypothetical protein ACFYEA_01635 [Candidatus Tripitaka californicus]|uniref:hypothetical protein n=1 Tax=Candidatus Tripitaka californicus TaxID=3367616 RepID=UPI004025836D|nr:hypothetical protein [Planctomycetota bacterium]
MFTSIRIFLVITILLLSLPSEQTLAQYNGRYASRYPEDFFNPGGTEVNFNPSIHQKIGILIQNRTRLSLSEIAHMIFKTAPLDRYKRFFYLRIEEEFREDIANNTILSTRAYDYSGRAIPRGLPLSEGQGSFNLVFLRFSLREVIRCSCKGVTIQTNQGNFAYVGEDSILHEVGHAFAGLADEYSDPRASDFTAVNLEDRHAHKLKWSGLIEKGFLPNRKIERREIVGGIDRGRFLIPSNNCYMNNHQNDDRYCPVCQLAIISRISQLSGVTPPWQ